MTSKSSSFSSSFSSSSSISVATILRGRGRGRQECLLLFAFFAFFAVKTLFAAVPPSEEWCGTGSNPLPGLWQETWLEIEALEEFRAADDWSAVSNRLDALSEDLVDLHLASLRQGARAADAVWNARQSVANQRAEILDAVPAHDLPAYTAAIRQIRSQLEKLPDWFSPAALRSMAVDAAMAAPPKPTITFAATATPLAVGEPAHVRIRLQDAQGGPVGEDQLLDTHTRKLHALVIDSSLVDYHHEHPTPTGRPGEFRITFTPQKAGDYLLWLNFAPAGTGRTEAPRAVLAGTAPSDPAPPRSTRLECLAGGWHYQLRLDPKTVRSGQPVNARLRITDAQGRPCFGLEPLMGTFAHVVGFMDDRQTMLHVHSPGRPPKEDRRGGPEVPFTFAAPKAGQLSLFVQTRIGEKVVVSEFSLRVEE